MFLQAAQKLRSNIGAAMEPRRKYRSSDVRVREIVRVLWKHAMAWKKIIIRPTGRSVHKYTMLITEGNTECVSAINQ
jgi:hypothetical protein